MKVSYKNRYTEATFEDLLPGIVFTLKEDPDSPYIVIDELNDDCGHTWNAVALITGEPTVFDDGYPVFLVPAELIIG